MNKAFTIPSIFTAVDKLTAPVARMGMSVQSFGQKAEAALSRIDRKTRPIGKAFFKVGTAVAVPLGLAVNEARKFETALQSFRTIVSDLSDKDFKKYSDAIKDVGSSTNKSYTEVAESFEKIAGLNAKFAETSEGISAVSKAAITLSKASGADLGQSAENLVGIMNQFSLGATEANRTINVLAAGQAVGAANINQTAEAFVNFGSVAAGANISLEQSVALIQTLGKFSVFGSEAGTKLRGSILRLQRSGLGYASGQFKVNDALEAAKKKLDNLGSAKRQDAYLNKLFGAENIATGRILLSNIGLYKEFSTSVTGTSEAQKAAAINQKSFAARLQNAKASLQNLGVTIGEALLPPLTELLNKMIPIIEKSIKWIKENKETSKTILKISLAVMALSYTISGIANVITGVTKVVGVFNAVLALNPAIAVGIGIAALAAGLIYLATASKAATAEQRVANQVRQRALESTLDQRVEVTMLFTALRRAKTGSEEYNETLKKLEAIQPGIIANYRLTAGAIDNVNKAEKDLMASIMKRAEVEARAEIFKEKVKELVRRRSEGPGVMDKLIAVMASIPTLLTTGKYFTAAGIQNIGTERLEQEANILQNQVYNDQKPVNTKATEQDAMIKNFTQRATVDININDKSGSSTVSSNNGFVNIFTSPSFTY